VKGTQREKDQSGAGERLSEKEKKARTLSKKIGGVRKKHKRTKKKTVKRQGWNPQKG